MLFDPTLEAKKIDLNDPIVETKEKEEGTEDEIGNESKASSVQTKTDELKSPAVETKPDEEQESTKHSERKISPVKNSAIETKCDEEQESTNHSERKISPVKNSAIETKRDEEQESTKPSERKISLAKNAAVETKRDEEQESTKHSERTISPAKNSAVETKPDEEQESTKPSERKISPAKNSPSPIIFIRNLVRPLTLLRLRELLEKTGKLVENRFWIDKIKSKCYATYENVEDAIASREALHGIKWPDANPKKLAVDFATEDELDYHLNLDKDPSLNRSVSKPPGKVNEPMDTKKENINNGKFDLIIKRSKRKEKEETDPEEEVKTEEKSERSERLDREKRPIREWDREKFAQKDEASNEDAPPQVKRRKEDSPDPKVGNRKDNVKEKDRKLKESNEGNYNIPDKDKNITEKELPAKLLDDLFKKTKAAPCIYWLPLDEEQAQKRVEVRAKNFKRREEEFAAREAARRNRFEKQERTRRRTPQYERRDRYSAPSNSSRRRI